jgi:hypothetical protein
MLKVVGNESTNGVYCLGIDWVDANGLGILLLVI